MSSRGQITLVSFLCVLTAVSYEDANGADVRYGGNEEVVWMPSLQVASLCNALGELGPCFLRMNIRWGGVEPAQGKWSFAAVDETLAQIPATTDVLCVLLHIPGWANGGHSEVYAPTNLIAWSNYVNTVVARYKSRIKHWEILNEPNGQDFFQPQPDPVVYADMLKLAYQAAKRADSSCVVVFGGMQGNGVEPFRWQPFRVTNFLANVYQAGATNFFDVCAIHPYVTLEEGPGEILAASRKTLEVMANHGDMTKPLWITEIGFGPSDEIAQARLLCDTFAITSLEPRIHKIIWFGFSQGISGSMSLLDSQWRRKPSFRAFQGWASQGDFSGFLVGGTTGQQAFRLTLFGEPGVQHLLQFSTDLPNWHDQSVLSPSNGMVDVEDTSSSQSRLKFYRTSRPASSCVPSPAGMVAFWTGDDTASDNAGRNHGSLTGGATYASGVVNRSFIFDGTEATVVIPASDSLDFHNSMPMTLEMWAYRIGTAAGQNIVGKRSGCGGDANEIQYKMSFDSQRGLTFGSYRQFVETHQQLPVNKWTHLAATYDGSTLRFFINGDLAGSTNGLLGPVGSAQLKIGGSGDCIPFCGLLDEVSIYSRALSQPEIQGIVAAGSRGKCR